MAHVNRKKPKVSVNMPFFDDGRQSTRHYFVQSVKSVLNQTFTDFELIVILSGKRGFAEKIAQGSKKIRVFYCSNDGGYDSGIKKKVKGLAMARNLGVAKARGEILAFADADDICEKRRLEKQYEYLETHPEVGAVGSCMTIIDENGKINGYRGAYETDKQIRHGFLQFNTVPQPTIMIRKRFVLKAGGYSENEIAEDYDLWIRVAKIARFHNLQEPLVKYRIHGGSGAMRVSIPLYLGSLRVKWRAAIGLGLVPRPKDIVVNLLQIASLLFPTRFRRTVLEKLRGKIVIGR